MIRIIYLLTIIVVLGGCTKMSVENQSNYMQAKIGKDLITVYEDASLNTDTVPNTFSFSFGQGVSILKERKNTSLFIKVCLNNQSFGIEFPKSGRAQTYNIYRTTDLMDETSAYYMKVKKVTPETGIEVFHTRNMTNKDDTNKIKVGEISINQIDFHRHVVEGTFSYTAYGYTQLLDATGKISSTNTTVKVSDGKFYYSWSGSLEI